ncbi:hypothetical protein BVG16_02965 [Paenibacillus selenitireducens]|uniref:DUF4430 domain-containing protein n=1 Tax=Paenibacillus selenitireducens TaxID=1324314 RepID=A0A1T2XNN5_9BACL|nr:hypothetical protein [Paenibacillus selenitireducens]OPA81293.1 hypothetical protein BVG16_02965 [Paenibacillus selenitireducens]
MLNKLLLRLSAMLLILLISACSTTAHSDQALQVQKMSVIEEVPMITIDINGGKQVPNITNSIHSQFTEGNTLQQLLEGSGLIKLSNDKKNIVSVNDVALDSSHLDWGILLNGKELTGDQRMQTVIQKDDILELFIKEASKLTK